MAKRSSADYAIALAMRDRGCTYREIGEYFGVGPQMGSHLVWRGMRLVGRKWVPSPATLKAAETRFANYQAEKARRMSFDWRWRDWNEWVATPMIGRNDDNTILAAL